MRIDIITVVPELLASPLNESILKRAQESGHAEIYVARTSSLLFCSDRESTNYLLYKNSIL